MKAEFQVMQKKLDGLEEKVTAQQTQIDEERAAKQVYENWIKYLEDQLAKGNQPAQPPSTLRAAVGKWTPEIGVVADTVFTSTSTKADEGGANRVSLRE